jgi:hypothetical protein
LTSLIFSELCLNLLHVLLELPRPGLLEHLFDVMPGRCVILSCLLLFAQRDNLTKQHVLTQTTRASCHKRHLTHEINA